MNAAAIAIAFGLDLAVGDPAWLPHPVLGIGKLVSWLEIVMRRLFPASPGGRLAAGGVLVLAVCLAAFFSARAFLDLLGGLDLRLAYAVECCLGGQLLAGRGLADAARQVAGPLAAGDLAAARRAVGRIVGRDVAALPPAGVARAAVESVAENASDGVVAPLLYLTLGGLPLALLYKAVNTMDSMLGYRNDAYLHFGRAAARLDDLANFLPARLTALAMIPAAGLARLDWRGAWRIHRLHRHRHASPNAGHPEAACAGALGLRLGGPAAYGGRTLEKPFIGTAGREAGPADILRAVRLLRTTSVLSLLLFMAGRLAWDLLRDGGWPWS